MRIRNLALAISASSPCFVLAEPAELEVIEVTAQFRTENIQRVPISMSAINGDDIEKLDISDASAIARKVPGVTLAEFAPGQSLLSIRGIVSADDGAGMDNSVVVFLDGIYIGRLSNIDTDLFDIERIEVLRGPQGTIAGRNTIGGAINIITRAPENELNAALSVTGGNYNAARARASITGALSDSLSGKVTLSHRERDGFTRNVVLNEDNQDENKTSFRAQLQLDSQAGLWRLSADHSEDARNDMGRVPVANGNFDYIGVWQTLGGGDYKSTSPISGFSNGTFRGFSLNGVNDFDNGQLTSIFGWRHSETDWEMASVGAPLGGNYDVSNGVFGADVNDDIVEDTRQHSAELRWNGNISTHLEYTLGVFYLRERTERIEQYKIDSNSVETGQITVGNEVSEQFNDTRSAALYGQINWKINSDWQLTAGARLTRDKKTGRIASLNCAHQDVALVSSNPRCAVGQNSLGILQQSFAVDVQDSWQDFSPKIALQYAPQSNWMLYGNIAKGFKSGGFPGSPGLETVARQSIEPEKAINYELGFKSDLLNNKLRLNGSVFYTDYDDLQVTWFGPSDINPGFGSFVSTNIQESEISGAELEFQWVVNDYLSLSGNYALLNTEVSNFILTTFGGERDLSGTDLRQAPENKSYFAADMDYPLSRNKGSLTFHIDYQFVDEQLSDYLNQNVILESHELVNVRFAWQNSDESIEIAAWAKNLLDETYISHAYVIGPGIMGTFGAPRTYGLTVNWRFE